MFIRYLKTYLVHIIHILLPINRIIHMIVIKRISTYMVMIWYISYKLYYISWNQNISHNICCKICQKYINICLQDILLDIFTYVWKKKYVNMQNICMKFWHMLDILTYVRCIRKYLKTYLVNIIHIFLPTNRIVHMFW